MTAFSDGWGGSEGLTGVRLVLKKTTASTMAINRTTPLIIMSSWFFIVLMPSADYNTLKTRPPSTGFLCSVPCAGTIRLGMEFAPDKTAAIRLMTPTR